MTTSHYYTAINAHTYTHRPYIAISNHNIADYYIQMNDFVWDLSTSNVRMQKLKNRFLQPDLMFSTFFALWMRSHHFIFLQNRKNIHYRVANCIELTRFYLWLITFLLHTCFRFDCVHSHFISWTRKDFNCYVSFVYVDC